jgi:hypothetical protein
MCYLCGGSICAGTGGCSVVVNQAPEVIKISYSYAGSGISMIQSYFVALFSITKDSFIHVMKYLRLRK